MGREAECVCTWGKTTASVKALLESNELILRGEMRRRVPFAAMQHARTEGNRLCFDFQGESVSLALGNAVAAKWAQVIAAPPASLVKKLGITSQSSVWTLGSVDDSALQSALAEAKTLNATHCDLIVAHIETPDDLIDALKKTASKLNRGVPLWLIYPKGQGHALRESDVRSAARAIGLIDSKVASVSSSLTALRFIKRKD